MFYLNIYESLQILNFQASLSPKNVLPNNEKIYLAITVLVLIFFKLLILNREQSRKNETQERKGKLHN